METDIVRISKKIGSGSGKGVSIARWFQQILGEENHQKFLKVISYEGVLEDFKDVVRLWTETKWSELYEKGED